MTLEEELKWLASQDLQDPFLERLRDSAAQQAAAADHAARRRWSASPVGRTTDREERGW